MRKAWHRVRRNTGSGGGAGRAGGNGGTSNFSEVGVGTYNVRNDCWERSNW